MASETVVCKPSVEILGQNNNFIFLKLVNQHLDWYAFCPHEIKRLGNLFWSYWTCTYLRWRTETSVCFNWCCRLKLLYDPDCWLLILCTCCHHAIGRWNECWLPLQKLQDGLDISSHLGFKPREGTRNQLGRGQEPVYFTPRLQRRSRRVCSFPVKPLFVVVWPWLKQERTVEGVRSPSKAADSLLPLQNISASFSLVFTTLRASSSLCLRFATRSNAGDWVYSRK